MALTGYHSQATWDRWRIWSWSKHIFFPLFLVWKLYILLGGKNWSCNQSLYFNRTLVILLFGLVIKVYISMEFVLFWNNFFFFFLCVCFNIAFVTKLVTQLSAIYWFWWNFFLKKNLLSSFLWNQNYHNWLMAW